MLPRTAFLVKSVLIGFALVSTILAQDETPTRVTNQNRSGDLPFTTSIGTGVEQVDVVSGSLKIRIPIASVKGRGLDYNFVVRYDTSFWAAGTRFQVGTGNYQVWNLEKRNYLPDTTGLGWEPNQPFVTWVKQTQNPCNVPGGPTQAFIYTSYIYHDAMSGKHPLAGQVGGDCYGTVTVRSGPDFTFEGIWATAANSQTAVTLSNGTQLKLLGTIPCDIYNGCGIIMPGSVDSNGNQQTEAAAGLDTLGRAIVTQQNGTNQILYKVYDSGGTQRTYTLNFSNVSLSTNFNVTGLYGTLIRETGGTRKVLTSLVLPSNTGSYSFQYESGTYGGLTRIDLPTGAYITYTWGTFYDGDRTHRYVTGRTVHIDGQNFTWTISRQCTVFSGHCTTITSTVTDPSNNVSVYTSGAGVVTSAKLYNGAAVGNPTRQYTIDYNSYDNPLSDEGAWLPIRFTKTLDDGRVSKKEFDYESLDASYTYCPDFWSCNTETVTTSRGNVNEIREYDYGSVPGVYGQGTPGPLLRRTDNSYLHNSNSNYITQNIVDKIITQTMYDGAGTQKAQTQFEYDTYTGGGSDLNPLLSTSGVAQHDYTNFPSTFQVRGNATRVYRWRDTDGVSLRTATYQYDDLGNIRLIRDALLYPTQFSYTDSFANGACPVPTGKTGQAWVSQVTNPYSQLIQVVRYPCTGLVQAHKDQNDINASRTGTTYQYDLLGRVSQKKTPDGGQVDTTYSDTPPASSTATAKITSGLNLVSTAIQDGLGRPRKTQLTSDPDGTTSTRIAYDALGRKYQVWNATRCDPDSGSCPNEPTFGYTTTNYDVLNRPTSVVEQDGSTVTTAYSGNCTTVTDEAGKARQSCSDALGRLTTVFEDPGSGHLNYETDYQYDTLGNMLRVDQKGDSPGNSANWRTRTFTYNSLSQLLTANNPESGTISYGYDNDGNLYTKTSPAPNQTNPNVTQAISYCYDKLNRLSAKGYGVQACTNGTMPTPVASYFYDQTSYNGLTIGNGVGQRTGMSDASGATAWSYDITAIGWTTTERRTINGITPSNNIVTQNNFDGSLASIVYPSGRTVTYTAGAAGRPTEAKDIVNGINYVTGAHYSPPGTLAALTNAGSIYSTFLFNSRLQPCWTFSTTNVNQILPWQGTLCTTTGAPVGLVMDRKYNFNLGAGDNGNVIAITNNVDTGRSVNFTYDNLNRITTGASQATSGSKCWGQMFGHMNGSTFVPGIDAWGNLFEITATKCGSQTLSQGITTRNQFASPMTYDAAGNLTNDGHPYTYDAENRLSTAGGATYVYDGDGNRVMKIGGTMYWGAGPLAERDQTGNWTDYVFFGGKRVARQDANTHYFFNDHLGSTGIVTNSTGAMNPPEQDLDYYPYGGIAYGTASDHYLFTGKERDSESGLDNFGARYDASNMGRFMTPDWSAVSMPVPYAIFADPQSLNLYAYVRNNPLSRMDVDGHIDCSGSNAAGPGCQSIAAWNRLHEVSNKEWARSNFDKSYYSQESQSGWTSQRPTSGHYVAVSDWRKSAGGFHHVGLAVDSDDTQGFSTNDPHASWWKRIFWAPKGRMEDDIDMHTKNGEVAPHSYLYHTITAAQANAIKAAIAQRRIDAGRYNFMFNNCAHAVESFLHTGGVPGVPHREIFVPFVLHAILLIERDAQ